MALGVGSLLSACGSSDAPDRTLGAWTIDQVQAVRGTNSPKPAVVVNELAAQTFPIIPDEARPTIRSEKERNDLKAALQHDRAEAEQTQSFVATADDMTKAIPGPDYNKPTSPVIVADFPPPIPPTALPATPIPPPMPPKPMVLPPVTLPESKATPAPPPDTTTAVQNIYRQRLAESAAPLPPPKKLAVTDAGTAANDDTGVRPSLVPPAEYRRRQAALGFQPLDAFNADKSEASFEVGSVRFGEGTFEMSAGQTGVLNQVFSLFRQKGGRIRVIGHSISGRLDVNAKANREANSALARGRAEAVARELIHLGIPGQKIFAGAAPSGSSAANAGAAIDTSGEEANIYIDY